MDISTIFFIYTIFVALFFTIISNILINLTIKLWLKILIVISTFSLALVIIAYPFNNMERGVIDDETICLEPLHHEIKYISKDVNSDLYAFYDLDNEVVAYYIDNVVLGEYDDIRIIPTQMKYFTIFGEFTSGNKKNVLYLPNDVYIKLL